jgi:hypothetical protein
LTTVFFERYQRILLQNAFILQERINGALNASAEENIRFDRVLSDITHVQHIIASYLGLLQKQVIRKIILRKKFRKFS